MSFRLDHVAVSAFDVGRSVAFYEGAFGLAATRFTINPHPDSPGASAEFAHFLDVRGGSLHCVRTIPNFSARFRALELNSTAPHVALTVSGLAGLHRQLDAIDWKCMPPKDWGPAGFWRLYTEDPFCHTVELNERAPGSLEGAADAPTDEPWRLDHVAVRAFDLGESGEWYGRLLGTPREARAQEVENVKGLVLGEPDSGELHLIEVDAARSASLGWWLDPVRDGHFAISVPDLDIVLERLERMGVPTLGLEGPERVVYTCDPSANVIEIRQAEVPLAYA